MRIRGWVFLLAVVCLAPFAQSDSSAPDGYDCAPGAAVAGRGCRCPHGRVPSRKDGNIAICAVAMYEVTIDSRPTQAIVRIGSDVRLTPLKLKLRAGSKLDVVLEKDGYLPQSRTLEIDDAQTFTIDLAAKPDLKLRIQGDANLKDADVQLDGISRGRAPVTLDLKPGRHRVDVTKKGFEPFARWFEIESTNATSTLDVNLRPVPRIKVEGDANVTGADVFLDGKATGKAPLTVETTIGRHYVHVSKGGFEEWHSGWLDIAAEQIKTLAIVLKPTPQAPPKSTCPDDMVLVAAGTFWMGTNGNKDQRKVSVDTFCIDKTEVTVKAYQSCVATRGCQPAPDGIKDPDISDAAWRQKWRSSCNVNRPDRTEHPINCVDWDQAKAYCAAMNKRLPTEAEWEFAARGSDGRDYPWGKQSPSTKLANVCDSACGKLFERIKEAWDPMYSESDGWESTAPVGSFVAGASPYGVLDMAGNVAEWTNDWYAAQHKTVDVDSNPKGPAQGSQRVTKGGDWEAESEFRVTAAMRSGTDPATRMPTIGFRCAK